METKYLLTDEETGETVAEFAASDYPGGASGALRAASMRAYRRAAREERTSLLTGPGIPTRRYSPPYVRRNAVEPYRIQGPCGHWLYARPRPGGVCRECRFRGRASGATEG